MIVDDAAGQGSSGSANASTVGVAVAQATATAIAKAVATASNSEALRSCFIAHSAPAASQQKGCETHQDAQA